MKVDLQNNVLKKIYQKDKVKRFIQACVGLSITSLSFNIFCLPNNLVSGGISGLSIIIERIFNINPSIFILIVNMFILILGYIFLGKNKAIYSLVGTLLFPLLIELTSHITAHIHIEDNQLLLSTLFAGVMSGLGTGLVYKAGYTSGGTDILNEILSKYLKISIGSATYYTDGLIILFSGFVFGFKKILYGLLLLYIISYMIDRVIIGISSSKSFYIITQKPDTIKTYIIEKLHHSVTNFSAKGGFKGDKTTVLMTVLPTKEYYKLKNDIIHIDKTAFFVVTDAYEVIGGE